VLVARSYSDPGCSCGACPRPSGRRSLRLRIRPSLIHRRTELERQLAALIPSSPWGQQGRAAALLTPRRHADRGRPLRGDRRLSPLRCSPQGRVATGAGNRDHVDRPEAARRRGRRLRHPDPRAGAAGAYRPVRRATGGRHGLLRRHTSRVGAQASSAVPGGLIRVRWSCRPVPSTTVSACV
jgi:hypothetical protein